MREDRAVLPSERKVSTHAEVRFQRDESATRVMDSEAQAHRFISGQTGRGQPSHNAIRSEWKSLRVQLCLGNEPRIVGVAQKGRGFPGWRSLRNLHCCGQ